MLQDNPYLIYIVSNVKAPEELIRTSEPHLKTRSRTANPTAEGASDTSTTPRTRIPTAPKSRHSSPRNRPRLLTSHATAETNQSLSLSRHKTPVRRKSVPVRHRPTSPVRPNRVPALYTIQVNFPNRQTRQRHGMRRHATHVRRRRALIAVRTYTVHHSTGSGPTARRAGLAAAGRPRHRGIAAADAGDGKRCDGHRE